MFLWGFVLGSFDVMVDVGIALREYPHLFGLSLLKLVLQPFTLL